MQKREYEWIKRERDEKGALTSDKWYIKMQLGQPDPDLLRCGVMRRTVDYLETIRSKGDLCLASENINEARPGIALVAAPDSHTPGSQWVRVTTARGVVILGGDNALMYDNLGGVSGGSISYSDGVETNKEGIVPIGSSMRCTMGSGNAAALR